MLAKKPPPWVLAANLLDTQKVWGLTNAAIEPDWVIAELPHLLLRKHFNPYWSRTQGRVLVSEQISLFGLLLAPKKPMHYGRIDPVAAHDLFVRQGLVTGRSTRVPVLLLTISRCWSRRTRRRLSCVVPVLWPMRIGRRVGILTGCRVTSIQPMHWIPGGRGCQWRSGMVCIGH